MNKGITLIALVVFGKLLLAQELDTTALKYADEIKAETLRKHLEIIASDEYEGRETGKKGQKMTMEYLISQFKEYGIKDYEGLNYRQEFPLLEQISENVLLTIGGKKLELYDDFLIKPYFLSNELIKGKIKLYTKELKADAAFIWKEDTVSSTGKSIASQFKQMKNGETRVAFYYDENLDSNLIKYEHYYKKSRTKLESQMKKADFISIALTESGFNKVLKAAKVKRKVLDKNGLSSLEGLDLSFELNIDKPTNSITGENVIAFIEGTDKKEEVLIITAHYDHLGIEGNKVFNGADDDGSGTVSLLEIAESFKMAEKDGFKPRRSILIMPVSGEEKGLLGSKYYSENPVFPLENTIANLNIDMIGRYDKHHKEDSNYVYLIGSDKLSNDLHELSESVNRASININLDYRYNEESDPNRFYYRSDHYNFAKNGVPVIFYFSGVHKDYHKETDTVEKIDFDKTAKISRLVFLTAWELANREERIKVDKEED